MKLRKDSFYARDVIFKKMKILWKLLRCASASLKMAGCNSKYVTAMDEINICEKISQNSRISVLRKEISFGDKSDCDLSTRVPNGYSKSISWRTKTLFEKSYSTISSDFCIWIHFVRSSIIFAAEFCQFIVKYTCN